MKNNTRKKPDYDLGIPHHLSKIRKPPDSKAQEPNCPAAANHFTNHAQKHHTSQLIEQ